MIGEKKLAKAAMSDEELDNVAGGGTRQTRGDNDFLGSLGYIPDKRRDFLCGWNESSKIVDGGWSKAGITCVTKPAGSNQYFKDGKEISRDEAVAHVKANFSKIRDWNA